MGAFDKILGMLKIDENEDYDDYYDDNESDDKKSVIPLPKTDTPEEDKPQRKIQRNPGGKNKRGMLGGDMEVVRVEPKSIEDGRRISDLLLNNKVVFLDLEGVENSLAQRVVDFTSGATYAIDGTLQQMSNHTFVIAPPAVNVSGDFQNPMTGESFL